MENRLTLIEKIPKTRPTRAIYRCACGTVKELATNNVTSGATRSCGCLAREDRLAKMAANREAFAKGNTRHGMYGTGTHRSWSSMVQRCTNPNRHNYAYYGGRGIGIDPRWMSFDNFLADMGPRPDGMTLERMDNDKDYGPANCAWATMKQQSNNRRPRGSAFPTPR